MKTKSKNDYYKGAYRVILNGAPQRLTIELSKNALSLMRTTPMRGSFDQDATAVAYVKTLLTQRGVAFPKECDSVKAIVSYDVPDGLDWKQRRPRFVTWQHGQSKRNSWHDKRETWHGDYDLLKFELPNWDHIARVRITAAPRLFEEPCQQLAA